MSLIKGGAVIAGFILLLGIVPSSAMADQDLQPSPFTLEKAYESALERNEEITISRERLQQDRRDIAVATSNLYPQISAEAGYTRQKVFDVSAGGMALGSLATPRDYGTLTLKLEQHIYQWGKVWSGRKMAEYYFESSKFRHLRQIKEILFKVSTRYYEALLARKAIEIAKNALKRAEQQMARAKACHEVGILTQTDVLRARVQVVQSQEQLERANNQYDIALENLALEMGLEAVPGPLVEPREKKFSSVPVPELYQTALVHRQDLRQAKKQVRMAEERVDFEKADFLPNLSLEGRYIQTDESDLFHGEHDDWEVTLKLSYPLFTGGKTTAEVDKAMSGLKAATAGLKRLKKEIRTQVRSVYLDIQTQKKVIQQLEQRVNAAQQNYRQVKAQFEQGLVSAVGLVDAFTALNEAENRLAQAYYTYQLDQIRLELAMGTFQTDLVAKELSDEGRY